MHNEQERRKLKAVEYYTFDLNIHLFHMRVRELICLILLLITRMLL